MSEMVERVKVALIDADVKWYAERHPSVPEQEIRDWTDDDNYRAIARAAIEAMREPTDEMVDVGQDAFAEGINMVAGHPEPSDEASYQTYIAMIDAALSEVEG